MQMDSAFVTRTDMPLKMVHRLHKRLAAAIPICLLLALTASAGRARGSTVFYRELNLVAGYSERDRWVGEVPGALKNSVGCEYFGKVSRNRGDFLTFDLQARLSYHTASPSDEAWAVEIHNAWVEYKVGLGSNIRLGHFAPAFGLEQNVDTHGTLFQTLAVQDIGFKKDWGVAYRGAAGMFDYSVAMQLGSGMPIQRREGSFLATARIGNPAGRDFEWGVSVLRGDVLRSLRMQTIPEPDIAEGAVSKRRAGVDAQYRRASFLFKAEATLGRNGSDDVVGGLFQTDYTLASLQALTAQAQGRFWTDDPDKWAAGVVTLAVGGSYAFRPGWTLGVGVFHDFEKPDGADTGAYAQIYYFAR
jgi:hypothetical protein